MSQYQHTPHHPTILEHCHCLHQNVHYKETKAITTAYSSSAHITVLAVLDINRKYAKAWRPNISDFDQAFFICLESKILPSGWMYMLHAQVHS